MVIQTAKTWLYKLTTFFTTVYTYKQLKQISYMAFSISAKKLTEILSITNDTDLYQKSNHGDSFRPKKGRVS